MIVLSCHSHNRTIEYLLSIWVYCHVTSIYGISFEIRLPGLFLNILLESQYHPKIIHMNLFHTQANSCRREDKLVFVYIVQLSYFQNFEASYLSVKTTNESFHKKTSWYMRNVSTQIEIIRADTFLRRWIKVQSNDSSNRKSTVGKGTNAEAQLTC